MKIEVNSTLAFLALLIVPGLGRAEVAPVQGASERLKVYKGQKVSPKTIRDVAPKSTSDGITQDLPLEMGDLNKQDSTWGMGISTLPLTGNPSLSALANPGGPHQFQLDLGLGSLSSFSLDADLGYRYHMGEMGDSGLHFGLLARMSLAGANNLSVNLGFAPLAGLHLGLTPDRKTLLTFDAGPEVAITGGNIDFRFRSFSSLLGLSIHRMF